MDKPREQPSQQDQPRHEAGEPVTLQDDPAQFQPTGSAGLLNPDNDAERDFADMPNADEAEPDK